MSEIRVRIADHAVAKGDGVVVTLGLGSCVAIALHDAAYDVGGLAHVLLPSREMSRDTENRAKFPETAVPLLLEEMRALGSRGNIVAKIAGGASMFGTVLAGSAGNIGERNVAATYRALDLANIPLVAQDTGGDFGRSVYLHLRGGRVLVRSLSRGDHAL
jgi:chemotaxis protein CheD